KDGLIKKTDLMEYDNIRRGGLIAVNLREDDELIDVKLTDGTKDIILVTYNGMAIRFNESDARPLGRVTQGVKGISLDEDDYVIGMAVSFDDGYLLIVTENGFGKRTPLDEYRTQYRGGKGVFTYKITEKTGKIAGMRLVNENDDVMLISADGTIIRLKVEDISIFGRVTQGVTLMKMEEGTKVVSLARVEEEDEDPDEDDEDSDTEEREELVAEENTEEDEGIVQ
ncbi:MAG TPA: DNA gyrase subunit A, partial [Acholeplasma sp.]|nr:DNA gyrase subunit A [Acholeplasma sp.]